jgi:starvation-inducible DNA-binding protein
MTNQVTIMSCWMSRERAIFESIDIMAERVRRVGGMTIRCISHIGQLQAIKDDNGHIAKMIRAAIEICDNKLDYATSNLLQDIHK